MLEINQWCGLALDSLVRAAFLATVGLIATGVVVFARVQSLSLAKVLSWPDDRVLIRVVLTLWGIAFVLGALGVILIL